MIKNLRRYFGYLCFRAVILLGRIIPFRIAMWFGGLLGRLAYCVAGHERKKALTHLAIAFPDKSENQRREIAKKCFAHWGRMLFMLVALPSKSLAKAIRVRNIEALDAIKNHSEGRGVIVLSGHVGNWEALAGLISERGYPFYVIARKIYYHRYDKLVTDWRRKHGSEVIYQSEPAIRSLKILRKNEVLGIVPDQDVKSIDGIFVKFFGKEAYTPSAPAAFAMASGAPILPIFLVHEKGGFRLVTGEPIFVPKAEDKTEAIKIATEKWSMAVEGVIRDYPEQWVWFHRRWSTGQKD